jgi:hypothetical protein
MRPIGNKRRSFKGCPVLLFQMLNPIQVWPHPCIQPLCLEALHMRVILRHHSEVRESLFNFLFSPLQRTSAGKFTERACNTYGSAYLVYGFTMATGLQIRISCTDFPWISQRYFAATVKTKYKKDHGPWFPESGNRTSPQYDPHVQGLQTQGHYAWVGP